MSAYDADHEWKLLINGEWVPGASGTYDIVDPNTTEVVGRAPEASVAQADDAAAAARAALAGWSRTSSAHRAELATRLCEVLERRSKDWVELVQAETGSTITVARTMQVSGVFIDRIRHYARPFDLDRGFAPAVAPATALAPAGLIGAVALRQPVGVVACITPYNFPLTNVAGKIGPALAMGNTIVIKPAPQDPLGILLLGEAIGEAGYPPGVVNIVTGSAPDTGAALVASRDVDMISFTGSSSIGARIYENAGRTMKRLLMELGGKGALIMTEDCDISAAVSGIASVWGFHAGQICTAPTRVICHRSIFDQTVAALTQIAGVLTVDDARKDTTLVGPVITETQRNRVEAMIKGAVDGGATMAVGGARPDLPGYVVSPTLLVDVTPDMHCVREEFFGPVVVMLPHDGDDEALALANDSDYGLYSYVYAGDRSRAYTIAQGIRSGLVGLNSVAPHSEAPFGGFKMSGVGRDRGIYGLEVYSELQTVTWQS